MTEHVRFSIEVYCQPCRIRARTPESMDMGTQRYEAPETRTEP